MNYHALKTDGLANRCAVVLAGGDGVRMKAFVRRLRGDGLPKQYVRFFNARSMLEATLERARKIVPQERQSVVVTRNHLEHAEASQQLAALHPAIRVIVQPVNRDTGLGLLLALARLLRSRPDANIVVFPSDHFIEQEELFLAHVDAAFRLVEQDDNRLVLLGVAPTSAETDYGYIVPRELEHRPFPFGARAVAGFIEKPDPGVAQQVVAAGGFWNTMVMVFNGRALIDRLRDMRRPAFRCFDQLHRAAESGDFAGTVQRLFERAAPINFSRDILEALALESSHALLLLPVRGVYWSDWGSEQRIRRDLRRTSMIEAVDEISRERLPAQVV